VEPADMTMHVELEIFDLAVGVVDLDGDQVH
jgi:hypothetical protein